MQNETNENRSFFKNKANNEHNNIKRKTNNSLFKNKRPSKKMKQTTIKCVEKQNKNRSNKHLRKERKKTK